MDPLPGRPPSLRINTFVLVLASKMEEDKKGPGTLYIYRLDVATCTIQGVISAGLPRNCLGNGKATTFGIHTSPRGFG